MAVGDSYPHFQRRRSCGVKAALWCFTLHRSCCHRPAAAAGIALLVRCRRRCSCRFHAHKRRKSVGSKRAQSDSPPTDESCRTHLCARLSVRVSVCSALRCIAVQCSALQQQFGGGGNRNLCASRVAKTNNNNKTHTHNTHTQVGRRTL